jgi:hypothetical protein
LFRQHDLLVIHVDADVAGMKYSDNSIEDTANDLPCVQSCPPPSATVDALRKVVLRWMGEQGIPVNCVICTPSKSMEAWVVYALWPMNPVIKRDVDKWECHDDPEAQLGCMPKRIRIKKWYLISAST